MNIRAGIVYDIMGDYEMIWDLEENIVSLCIRKEGELLVVGHVTLEQITSISILFNETAKQGKQEKN